MYGEISVEISVETWRFLQCEAPKIAKLVNKTPITMVDGTHNYSHWGESKPTYNWGASHSGKN